MALVRGFINCYRRGKPMALRYQGLFMVLVVIFVGVGKCEIRRPGRKGTERVRETLRMLDPPKTKTDPRHSGSCDLFFI